MRKEAILIHGWDPDKYNNNLPKKFNESIAWSNRSKFIQLLQKQFNLRFYNLPGFCGNPEPKTDRYDLEDFTNEFADWMKKNQKNVCIIIGYSFGGAILLDYKARYKSKIPSVLISPAISRRNSVKSGFAHSVKQFVPKHFIAYLKDLYQKLTTEFYREGTLFLRKTYDVIARRDLRPLFKKLNSANILFIYGTSDEATPWNFVKKDIIESKLKYHLIKDGGHSIGQTHPKEILYAINQFLQ